MIGVRPILDIRDLSIALPPGSERTHAVEHVSLSVDRGETLCVVGESGSGKSLLAYAVMGLLPKPGVQATGGSILLDGQEVIHLDETAYRPLRGRRMSMIFQEPMTALNPLMTVGQQIGEVLRVHGVSDAAQRHERTMRLIDLLGLPDPESIVRAYSFQLSGGQRQRVMIAMAMALEPELLIADEPTTALDVTTQQQILELVTTLQRQTGIAVLFITHDFGVVAEIADRVAVMHRGRLIETGPTQRVLLRPEAEYTRRLIAAVPRLGGATPAALVARAPLLVVRNLEKTYGGRHGMLRRGREVKALDRVSLTVGDGEVVGVVGESGSGKSTLGHCILRLTQPDRGVVEFEGHDVMRVSPRKLRVLRPRLQMIFQDPYTSLNPRHRVGRALTETAIVHGTPPREARQRALRILELVGLDSGSMDRYPHEFSGGQRQRIGIARALMPEPRIIIADEPVSALDVSVQAQVLELLADVRKRLGLALIFITHDLRVASRICDRIAVMRHGRVVELGPVEQVLHRPQDPYTASLIASIPGRSLEANQVLA